MENRSLYVIVMRDTAFWVVGPFPDKDAMIVWGDFERANGDDPRWQSIEMFPYQLSNVQPITFHPGS